MKEQEEKNSDDERDFKALLSWVQSSAEDIRFAKKQQWNTLYLTLIALAGVLSLFFAGSGSNLPLFQACWFRSVLSLVCLFVLLLGIIFLLNYQKDINKYRRHAEEALESLDVSEKIKRFLIGKRSSDQWITFLFVLLAVIAAALSILIILFPDGSLNSTVLQRRGITPPGW